VLAKDVVAPEVKLESSEGFGRTAEALRIECSNCSTLSPFKVVRNCYF